MDVGAAEVQEGPARHVIRDAQANVVGVIERQRQIGKLIARDRRGVVVGIYEERARTTRNAHGRLIGRANLLSALLFEER